MSEKRDSASLADEVAKKKIKLDISSSSGSDSEEGDDSEEGAMDPPASAIVDKEGNWRSVMENKPRNPDDIYLSSGSVPASIHDQDSQTKKMDSSSTSGSSKDLPSSSISPGSKKRTLLYKKSLTPDDVYKFGLMIPLESGRKFLPEPKKHDGRYEKISISFMDHKRDIWEMGASFQETSSSYMLWLNWDRYLKIYKLEPADVIFFYDVPGSKHYLIEYEKKGRDSNPKEDDIDLSSGLVPASIHDQDPQTKKMDSSSASGSSKDQPCSSINPGSKTLLYKKSLTCDDVYKCRLMIPLESGRKFLPEPKKHDGRYDKMKLSFMDHKRDIWEMEASFQEKTRSYMLLVNWERYLKMYKLEPADVIFFYDVPSSKHYSIEYEKKGRDRNPKETT